MATIVLVCPSSNGHHQTYLRVFARTLLELGHTVAAFTPESGNLDQWVARTCPGLSSRMRVMELIYPGNYHVPGPLSVLFDKLAWVRFIARIIKAADLKPDLVFHTWLDNCLTPGLTAGLTDLTFPFKWSGLYFHPWYLRQNLGYSRWRRGPLTNHNALLSRNCPAVAVLDEGIADKLQALLGSKPVIVFPDIADDSAPDPAFPPATQIRERARGRKVIGLLGVLSKRKGMLMLLEVARRALQENWFFVFAGELLQNSFLPEEQQVLSEFVASDPPNCFFHFQRMPDEPQFNAVVAECDILFAVYQSFMSSSNLLTKAAIFKKPVLVSDAHCMGERVRKYGIGLTIAEDSVSQCMMALRQLCGELEREGRLKSARYEEYTRLHSTEQLRTSFEAVLTAANL